jgi:hypothetical protein
MSSYILRNLGDAYLKSQHLGGRGRRMFEASLGYRVRPCLRINRNQKPKKKKGKGGCGGEGRERGREEQII